LEKQYVLFDIHHLIADAQSIRVILNEFIVYYQGQDAGPAPLQFTDYLDWDQRLQTSEKMKAQEKYWLERFADQPVLEFPADFPRPKRQRFEGAALSLELGQAAVQGMEVLNQSLGTTPYMVFMAALGLVLHKLTGQEDLVIGSPAAARPIESLQSMVGMFVNTLAIRTFPSAGETLGDYLAQVKQICLEAMHHSDYPYSRLIENCVKKRDTSRNPLFDVMLVWQSTDTVSVRLQDMQFENVDLDLGTTPFDIFLEASKQGTAIQIRLKYATALFTKERMQGFGRHLLAVLEAMPGWLSKTIADIEIITPREKARLLEEFNATELEPAGPWDVVDRFEAQARKTPEAVACSSAGVRRTYRELDSDSNRLARFLKKQGIQRGTAVGICLERSNDLIMGVLGILKAGAAYVPIDPGYPRDRIAYMLENSGMRALITQSALAGKLPEQAIPHWCVDLEKSAIERESGRPVRRSHSPEDPMYIIYTSGSTGRPKGIEMSRGALGNLITWQLEQFRPSPSRQVLQYASINFDVSFQEIFSTLAAHPGDDFGSGPERHGGIESGFNPRTGSSPLFARDCAPLLGGAGARGRSIAADSSRGDNGR
jgi:non-ribosomal peptide synthetase component F